MSEPNPTKVCELCGNEPWGNWSLCVRCNAAMAGESRRGVRPPQVTKRAPADQKPEQKARSA